MSDILYLVSGLSLFVIFFIIIVVVESISLNRFDREFRKMERGESYDPDAISQDP